MSWLPVLLVLQSGMLLPACTSFAITSGPKRMAQTSKLLVENARRSSSLCMAVPAIVTTTMDTINSFSKSSLSSQLTQTAFATPPLAYFLALMAAGCGIPVSEDGLCLFAGAVWSKLAVHHRVRLFFALYLGVVGSDALTFGIGRALRMGVFPRIRERLLPWKPMNSTDDATIVVASNRKRDKLKRSLERSGDWVGFVIRFSVGTRGPLMLLSGFTNHVPFLKFILGSSLGALITLPLQLYSGHVLGHRHPGAIAGLVAGISSFCLLAFVAVGLVSWGAFLVTQVHQRRIRRQQGNANSTL